jgi:ABC-2 type transport system permease protein
MEAGRFPMVAYPAAYRFFFTFVVPVAFLTTVPAEAMLGRSPVVWVVGAGALALGLLLASNLLAICAAFLHQCFQLTDSLYR